MPYCGQGNSRQVGGYPEERRRSWLIGYVCYKSHIREEEQVLSPGKEVRAKSAVTGVITTSRRVR